MFCLDNVLVQAVQTDLKSLIYFKASCLKISDRESDRVTVGTFLKGAQTSLDFNSALVSITVIQNFTFIFVLLGYFPKDPSINTHRASSGSDSSDQTEGCVKAQAG